MTPDPRLRELATLLVDRSLDVQPGWQVSVRATPLARPLVSEVAKAIARRGAYFLPRINWGPDRFRTDLDWALEAPLELLTELPSIERYAVENEDARLTIRSPEDVHAGAELDPERRALLQRAMEPASRRARSLDVRWAVVQYPTEAAAAEAGMALPEFEDFVYDACLLDWDAEEQRMQRIKERFDEAESVRIVGAGTDLTLSVAGRSGIVSSGLRNMPDGEVFYSPVEDSAEGVIDYSEFPAVYLGHDVEGARLVFREGRVVESSATGGEDFLRQVLHTTTARADWASSASAATRASPGSRATCSSTRRSTAPSTSRSAAATPTPAARTRARCTGTWSRTCGPAASSTPTASSSSATAPG